MAPVAVPVGGIAKRAKLSSTIISFTITLFVLQLPLVLLIIVHVHCASRS